jgi:hypothetical protein
VVPFTTFADTGRLPAVLLHSSNEVTRAKFFFQSSDWPLVGTVIRRPASAPSVLVGDANRLVEVFEGRNMVQVGGTAISRPDQRVDEHRGMHADHVGSAHNRIRAGGGSLDFDEVEGQDQGDFVARAVLEPTLIS